MDDEATTDLPSALTGYARAAVEVFIEQAATRRTQLEATIAEASARRERAAAAQARNRAIAQDAQRELDQIRSDAEDRAAQIVLAGRLEAQVILRSARERVANTPTIDLNAADLNVADLNAADLNANVNASEARNTANSFATLATSSHADDDYDEVAAADYFEYLRSGLPVNAPAAE
jgi:hypothetical protein